MSLTADWSDDDIAAYLDFCAQCETPVDVPLTVWANESDNRTTAHNPGGDASGIFQLMPSTAKAIGYDVATDPHLAAFRQLGVRGQLEWARHFYGPKSGKLGTVARWYLCTFLPLLIDHGEDLAFVLCGARGEGPLKDEDSIDAYNGNRGFDREKKEYITVFDLVRAANGAVGPRTRELIARVTAAQAPDNPGGTLEDADGTATATATAKA